MDIAFELSPNAPAHSASRVILGFASSASSARSQVYRTLTVHFAKGSAWTIITRILYISLLLGRAGLKSLLLGHRILS